MVKMKSCDRKVALIGFGNRLPEVSGFPKLAERGTRTWHRRQTGSGWWNSWWNPRQSQELKESPWVCNAPGINVRGRGLKSSPQPPSPLCLCDSPGDQRHRTGLPATSAHGLPKCPAPAHAGLLAEGPQPSAQVWPDCQHAGQDDPKPQQPQSHGAPLLWVWLPWSHPCLQAVASGCDLL